MLVQTLPFHIDFKRKTFVVYHENDEAEQITVDNEGAGILSIEMFKSINVGALKGFIAELKEHLAPDQVQAILQLWGNSNAIRLSIVTDLLGGDRLLAKTILRLGINRGVLAIGVNSTWKVVNKEEQKTMKEIAEKQKRGPVGEAKSFKETVASLQKKGFDIGEQKEEEVVVVEAVEETVEEVVEIIPEEPIIKGKQDAEGELRAKLKALEHKAKTFTDWNETITPWSVNNEINAIKNQLRTLEAQKQGKQYIKEVNSVQTPTPKSITRITTQVTPAPISLPKPVAKSLPKKKLSR